MVFWQCHSQMCSLGLSLVENSFDMILICIYINSEDHRNPDKAYYSAISEASEALQSLIQSCSNSMKKPVKQNNQSFRSQKQTEHNKQNNKSITEQRKPKGSQQNQNKKNQIKELIKSFKRKLIHGQQNHNSFAKQRATTDQNPYIFIKQCEMNNCFDRKQQNKNNDDITRNTLGTNHTQSKSYKVQISRYKQGNFNQKFEELGSLSY
ncbi:Hypothetical_protein [Hexamita inflata]|uniref:Hypothetical_protein n=1 Tax=Hexamita inflata TaxID=28002 RepID=A0AA86QTZ5_9EUKA|nr:Hypothetical protein HINF_LOCUS53661 [Hexamita inflata]